MLQMVTRPYPLLARLRFLVLAAIILPFLPAAVVQAEEPQPTDSPDKVITSLPGSRAAGARWAEPWQEGGPKVLDTRRPAPPAPQEVRPAAPVSPRSPDLSPPTSSPPVLVAEQYRQEPYAWQFYRSRQFYPGYLYGYRNFDQRRYWRGFSTGRGYIGAGRPGFHGRGFRKGHPGFHGHRFKGRGFRGR